MNRMQKNFLTLFVIIILIAVLAEFTLRTIIGPPLAQTPNSMHIPLNDSERLWALKPNETGVQAGAQYNINSQGFRDYEYLMKKPDGMFRIAAIGDSVTFGKGVTLNETYSKVLEEKLNHVCDKKVEVLNFGVYGYNTAQEVATIREQALKFDPDVIVVLYVLNDPDVEFEFTVTDAKVTPTAYGTIKRFLNDHMYLYKLAARIYYAQSQIKKNKNLSILTFYPKLHNESYRGWEMVEEKFAEMRMISKKEGVEFVLFVQPELYILNKKYPFKEIHDQVIASANMSGIPAYDLFPYFKGENYRELRVNNFEDRHPNGKGHKIIALGMEETLLKEGFLDGCKKERSQAVNSFG